MTASQHLRPLTACSSLPGWFGVVPQLAGDLDRSLKPLSLLDRNIRAESPLALRGRIPPDPKHEGPEIPVWRWTFFELEQLWAGHELQIQIWSSNASFFSDTWWVLEELFCSLSAVIIKMSSHQGFLAAMWTVFPLFSLWRKATSISWSSLWSCSHSIAAEGTIIQQHSYCSVWLILGVRH